jgi:hypothetical protein
MRPKVPNQKYSNKEEWTEGKRKKVKKMKEELGGENVGVVQPIHRIKRKDPVLKVNDVPTSLC